MCHSLKTLDWVMQYLKNFYAILILSDHLKYTIIGEEDDTDDIKQTSF